MKLWALCNEINHFDTTCNSSIPKARSSQAVIAGSIPATRSKGRPLHVTLPLKSAPARSFHNPLHGSDGDRSCFPDGPVLPLRLIDETLSPRTHRLPHRGNGRDALSPRRGEPYRRGDGLRRAPCPGAGRKAPRGGVHLRRPAKDPRARAGPRADVL